MSGADIEVVKQYLDRARRSLHEANEVLNINLADAAGRSAYLAAFHAAQAFVLLRSNRVAKTHSGVRSEFSRLSRDDSNIDREFRTFLAHAYDIKTFADYGISVEGGINREQARDAIDTASRFIDCIAAVVETSR